MRAQTNTNEAQTSQNTVRIDQCGCMDVSYKQSVGVTLTKY